MPASTMSRLAGDAATFQLVLSLLLVLPTFLPGVVAGSYDPVYPPTRWAVLIAGSSGYWNYRHQADVCHAYQILRKGGLKDENIVVFMYDDIAYNKQNPRTGIIINHPKGKDVYAGVPKDYVGHDVTVNNFFAVLLGNKSALTGGSGKVVNSGPNDQIFVYYSDHGSPGLLAMPTPPHIYAGDLMDVLKKKHASKSYKSLVFYVEACEAGSMFEGLLREGLNIYATTASDATESSWATYCPGGTPSPPPEYTTCLGDVYSVSWMEDSETHDLRTRTLKQQYDLVKYRTSAGNNRGSHVIQYGDLNLNSEFLASYIGSGLVGVGNSSSKNTPTESSPSFMNQRDAELIYFWNKFLGSTEGSSDKREAQKQLVDAMSHPLHVDNSVELVGKFLLGREEGPQVLAAVRSPGQPLVDDWDCLKIMVCTFETYCGSLDQYGLKHMRAFANICNAGITADEMIAASSRACRELPSNPRSSLHNGYSA